MDTNEDYYQDNFHEEQYQDQVDPQDQRPNKRRRLDETEEQGVPYEEYRELDPQVRDADLTRENLEEAHRILHQMDFDDRTHPNAQLATLVEVALAKKRSDPVSDLWNGWLGSKVLIKTFLLDPYKRISTNLKEWILTMEVPDPLVKLITTKAGAYWDDKRHDLNTMLANALWSESNDELRQSLQEQGAQFLNSARGQEFIAAVATTFHNKKLPNDYGLPSLKLQMFIKERMFVAQGATSLKDAKERIGMVLTTQQTLQLYEVPQQFEENNTGHLVAIHAKGARAKQPAPNGAPKVARGKQGIAPVAPVPKQGLIPVAPVAKHDAALVPRAPAKRPLELVPVAPPKGQGKQALAPIPKQPVANQNGHEEDEHVQEQVPAVPAPPKAKRGRGKQSSGGRKQPPPEPGNAKATRGQDAQELLVPATNNQREVAERENNGNASDNDTPAQPLMRYSLRARRDPNAPLDEDQGTQRYEATED